MSPGQTQVNTSKYLEETAQPYYSVKDEGCIALMVLFLDEVIIGGFNSGAEIVMDVEDSIFIRIDTLRFLTAYGRFEMTA